MERIREILRHRVTETRATIERLMAVERELGDSLTYLEACRGCEELRPACLACTRCDDDRPDRHSFPAPDLVAELGRKP